MSHAVLKLDQGQIDKVKSEYMPYIQPTAPPGGLFVAKMEGCTITAYKSGKILFQGPAAERESSRWGDVQSSSTKSVKPKARKQHAYIPPENIGTLSLIGSDEVGTGDFFGPITVVAAYVSKEQLPLVKELGVKDSKLLKDPQIIEIAKDLIQTVPYSLLVLDNPKYNELQSKGMSQGKMKAMLHQKAIGNLFSKGIDSDRVDGVLIDQFCEPEIYFRHTNSQPSTNPPVYFETKAEALHLSVAAASIIARYAFLRKMDELADSVGLPLPKGAGPLVDEAAAKVIFKHGIEGLKNVSKAHFANTNKAVKIAQKKRKG